MDVKRLVRLARLAGENPRVHPNGFIQLDLERDGSRIAKTRLHVWPDGNDIPKQDVATVIHDHRFDMSSQVLLGTIEHTLYQVTLTPQTYANFTHEVYMAQYVGKESKLYPTGVKVYAQKQFPTFAIDGDDYFQVRYTFHDTKWKELSATVIRKDREDQNYEPRVLVPIGQKPDNSFVRAEAPQELLWSYIDRVLEQL